MDTEPPSDNMWTLFMDGSSTDSCLGVDIILISLEGVKLCSALCFYFQALNNQAKYDALVVGIRLAWEVLSRQLHVFRDSLLIINHINTEYQ